MLFTPGARKLALVAHVTASVGWMGAVAVFAGLSVVGLGSRDAEVVRAAYIVMGPTAWYVILPLCLASLATGVLQSLGTPWGLLRHYWVAAKLAINLLSTLILLVHLRPIDFIAGVARAGPLAHGGHVPVRVQMLMASSLAVLALLLATVLSVCKPRGLTPYGLRRRQESLSTRKKQARTGLPLPTSVPRRAACG
ncbi:MAG: hypothetical protein QOG31_560 [Thermoplasmata archaeon]|nr:hypothetical protein [Thermoplasmata archaeon]